MISLRIKESQKSTGHVIDLFSLDSLFSITENRLIADNVVFSWYSLYFPKNYSRDYHPRVSSHGLNGVTNRPS